jgi:hypothetical protein
VHADGDHAIIRIDDGLDINGVPGIDDTTLGSAAYGFENFRTLYSPGYIWNGLVNVGTGSGTYVQSIDATQLSEGRHYITVRAFRHRNSASLGDGGPAVFTDFKRTIYIDRLPPEAAVVSFAPYASAPNDPNNRDLVVRSVDQTADSMHILLDLPANLTEPQILALVNSGNRAGYYDRDQFIRGFGVNFGNHVATVVTYEPTGNYNIQRFAGLFTQTNNRGRGFGDMNFNNSYVVGDILTSVGSVEDVLYSQNSKYSSAFDVNGDGLGDNRDLYLLGNELVAAGAGQAVLDAYTDLLRKRGDVNSTDTTDAADMAALYASFDSPSWLMDFNVDGAVDLNDVDTMISEIFRTARGDFNLDGSVSAADYVIWRKSHSGSGTRFIDGDADLDGDVDESDYGVWRSSFGFVRQELVAGMAASPPAMSVPEPAILASWILAFIGWCLIKVRVRDSSCALRI